MNVVLGTARIAGHEVLCRCEPDGADWPGVRLERSPTEVTLRRDHPGTRPLYYRIEPGAVRWSDDLREFTPATPDPGHLLALVHGTSPAPDATGVPGVHRLVVGAEVRVDESGVAVRRATDRGLPPGDDLGTAVTRVLNDAAGCPIAYSGGLASAFLAAAALSAGHRPTLLHADLGPGTRHLPTPSVPGLTTTTVPIEITDLVDHRGITGAEPVVPLPDVVAPMRLMDQLAAGGAVISGALLEDLVSVRLPDVDAGVRGIRLLGLEPFHVTGVLRDLAQARALVEQQVVYPSGAGDSEAPAERPPGSAPPPRPPGSGPLPGLTRAGEEAYAAARLATTAVWNEHLDSLDPVVGRAVAGLEERGHGGALLPALNPGVLAAAAALRSGQIGRIRAGRFHNHLPLLTAVTAHGIAGVRRTPAGYWLRLAAAHHLRAHRTEIAADLTRSSALADLGLIDPARIVEVLADGRDLAGHALPLLRLVWVERWLRRRS
ncbi:hypothetical protein [Actinokineospora diospyrosa]|uniref:Asparagine synthase n=1 Tax=Actinokineospora diospyrosa TaxID=103728 RepID=A0ABT1IJ42_9PSEU|nr:hypothetical protein [Actinokineospora diospyrosa]MCP2272672.1 hypothetical protein [Actinokineospora diospyrosa]